jgi:transcriptional regulator with XRE-family HTH domain
MKAWHGKANLVSGRQLRAARALAGLTQKDLADALGINERAVRFWERKLDRKPMGRPNDLRIEDVLQQHGVLLFATPTPGVRMTK